jgi:hypothetical protein
MKKMMQAPERALLSTTTAGAAGCLRGFLAAGGRILMAPDGKTETSFDPDLIFGGNVPEALAADRYRTCQAFVQDYRRPAGARFTARAVRMLGAATPNGWLVLHAAAT